jgi:cyanophycinase
MNQHVFLFGGGPPFTEKMAKKYVSLLPKKNGSIVLLVLEREGWEAYMPKYTTALSWLGVNEFIYLPLPSTPIAKVIECVLSSSGIIIGGGDTNSYADYIVDTPISTAIQDRVLRGVPLAGFSAGALLTPDICVISGKDHRSQKLLQRKGLGLLQDMILSVHYSEWEEKDHLLETARLFSSRKYYGIDEQSCIWLKDNQIQAFDGKGIYELINDEVVQVYKGV